MYGSWEIRHNSFLSYWAIFCPLTLRTTWKIKVLKKWRKKTLEHIILYLHIKNYDHMMYGSWDKWGVLSFSVPRETKKIDGLWFAWGRLVYIQADTVLCTNLKILWFLILDHFLPFFLPNNPENQNFRKIKKTPGDIIISQKCTINDNHMMYHSWEMKSNRQNFLSFFAIFCPITLITT